MPGLISDLSLYWNTVKYLKPVQIYGRVFSNLKKKFQGGTPPVIKNPSTTDLKLKSSFLFHDPWNKESKLIKGEFTFLNTSKNIGFPPRWDSEAELLWQFNLHYFNWLHLLNPSDKKKTMDSWIDNNQYGKGAGWHPYVLSLRIVSWCKNQISEPAHLESLYQQAYYLYHNLEYYHPANHYLENAKALIFTGVYLKNCPGSEIWIEKGLKILSEELPKQILNDGAYFELSPMYHCLMLEGLLDLINILPGKYDKSFLVFYAARMLKYLQNITKGNPIPLFNDSTYEIASSPGEIMHYAECLGAVDDKARERITNKKDSGVHVINNEKLHLVIDAGEIGPDYIPAHSHADIFTYELFYDKIPFIVDSGVYEYKAGAMRDYARSTKAHNTLVIDDKDQAEYWGSFRVGRRYKPFDVIFKEEPGMVLFEGKFNGYSNLIGDNLLHKRKIAFEKNKSIISVEDSVEGSGKHVTASYIHIHPDVVIKENANGFLLSSGNTMMKIDITGSKYLLEEGWYSPEFGKKISNKVIKIYSEAVPSTLSYKIHFN